MTLWKRILLEKRLLVIPLAVALLLNVIAYIAIVRPLGVKAAGVADRAANAARAVATAERDLAARQTLVVKRRSGARPYTIVASCVPLDATGLTPGRQLVAVFIADPDAIPPDTAAGLQAAYDLTPAEADLVALLAHQTPSLAEAAQKLGVSVTTVKTHLKHCFEKTGAQRQTELVRLALSMTSGLPRT